MVSEQISNAGKNDSFAERWLYDTLEINVCLVEQHNRYQFLS